MNSSYLPDDVIEMELESLAEQIAHNKPAFNERPLTIYLELDQNKTFLKSEQISFLITKLKEQLIDQFSLITPINNVFIFIYAVFIIFGLISNTMMIYAFYRAQRLRTYRNVFIINLAINDIILCCVCAPLTLRKYTEIKWYTGTFGRLICKLGPGLQTTSVMVTAFTIVIIAIDRWQLILHSKKIGSFFCILFIWILAFMISIPSFIVNDTRIVKLKPTNEVLYTVCEEIWFYNSFKYAYSILTIIFQYLVPLMIVSTTYCQICHFLYFKVPDIYSYSFKRENNRRLKHTSSIKYSISNNKTSIQERQETTDNLASQSIYLETDNQKVSKSIYCTGGKIVVQDNERFSRSKHLLLAVCLSFAFCWLPLLILNLYLDLVDNDHKYSWETLTALFLTSHLIATLSCCINPILYGLLNTNFKDELVKIIHDLRSRK